jgi:SNF family Na+-dependent transporter
MEVGGTRERWTSRVGLILAAAGNAIGLGNLLRFPSKVALYGGGAFMVPYILSLFLLGLPLMILEWVVGRTAGEKGRGSMSGIFGVFFKESQVVKTIGSLGVLIPFLIASYYLYIESWTLGYSFLSLFKAFYPERISLEYFLNAFRAYVSPSSWAVFFLVLTLLLNFWVLLRGISKGIELVAKVGLPLLFGVGCFLAVFSLSLGGWKGLEGLVFMFKPDFPKLKDFQVWIEAAGQIFFTLSLGMGCIAVYASYSRPKEDIVKVGLWTAALNEIAEIGLGGCIAIPAAFALFGASSIGALAAEGTFRIGFVSMPAVLFSLPFGFLLSFLWFFLLFIAAITSSLALAQPLIAFFEDELGWGHRKAVLVTMSAISVGSFCSAFVPGFIDELDFWAGTFLLVLFAFLEVLFFVWIWGPDRFKEELERDSFLRVPRPMVYVLFGISGGFLLVILYLWALSKTGQVLAVTSWSLWVARIFILISLLGLIILNLKTKKRG